MLQGDASVASNIMAFWEEKQSGVHNPRVGVRKGNS